MRALGHPNEADRIFGREAAQAGTSYLTKDNLGMSIGSENVTYMTTHLLNTLVSMHLMKRA